MTAAPDPADLPPEDLPGGPVAWMTGPEHLVHADALLSGVWRTPHKWSDRIAAAAVHVQAAHVQLMATILLRDEIAESQKDALVAHWMNVLRVPPDVDGIEVVAAEWAAHHRAPPARRPGRGGEDQGGDAG